MALFWKAAAAALVISVLSLSTNRQEKDFSLMISMAGCAMVAMIALHFLEPVLDFVNTLRELGDLNAQMLRILVKAVGVGLVSELAAMVCSDAGNSSLGKMVQLTGSAVILWLSLPLFEMLMDLLKRILGEV